MVSDSSHHERAPPSYFRVVDTTKVPSPSFICIVLRRGKKIRSIVPLWRWIWLCILEAAFGEELLESLVTTASNSGCPEYKDEARAHGQPHQLALHIPTGLFTDLFRNQLVELLYYKFYLRYALIVPVVEPYMDATKKEVYVSDVRFAYRKALLWQVIAFRRVYLLEALSINLAADVAVWFATSSLQSVAIAAISIESLRRLMKI